jgi:cytoskeletal protein CcmA (bactofilin family)
MRNRPESQDEQTVLPSQNAETVVGSSLKIEGDLKSESDIRIDGEVTGSVMTKGNVHIGPGASVTATVQAANAFVAGRVTGDIMVQKSVSLESTARVKGNITSAELAIARGAQFNGASTMTGEETARVPAAKARAERSAELVSV